MAELILKNVNKKYPNGFVAVRDFNLKIKNKEFITITGPSGSGKSTVLRMIAGLESLTSGEILADGKRMDNIEPEDRDIAMLFKNYALYPRMTVFDNIALGLRLRNVPEEEVCEKVNETVQILSLENLVSRKVRTLPVRQRLRVAIGRVILRKPGLILMEEPFSELEADLRIQMWNEIARLHDELQTTIIYVTNDPAEAMSLGSRVVVMADGEILQEGAPHILRQRPSSTFVAEFIGMKADDENGKYWF